MEIGNISVEPFVRENLGTNSIDLTLNPKMLIYENGASYLESLKDNVDQEVIMSIFSVDSKSKNTTQEIIIPETGFVLTPGQLYIASTNEYTETWNAVPKLEGKSSLGRLGLWVHVTAGYGDVGFCGNWTLELVCVVPIKIYPNMKICQISYHGISDQPLISYDKKTDAKYSRQVGAVASRMHENFVKE